MKRFLLLILGIIILSSAFPAVYAEDGRTYGVDNLNNEPGDLIIGFIGGSITEGSGATSTDNRYTSLVVENYFRKNYPEKNVIERNVAIGGTGSDYGHIRIKNDLLNEENTPDVVFVEFASNDSSSAAQYSDVVINNMESIVRQLLDLPKIPAIVFVYTTNSGNGIEKGANIEASIATHHVVAENYGIYEINIDEHIWNGVKEGRWTWNQQEDSDLPHIANDSAHPNNFGYGVYADLITQKLSEETDKAFAKLDPKTAPCGSYVYGNLEEIPLSDPSFTLSKDWEYMEPFPADPLSMGRYTDRFFKNGYYYTERCQKDTVETEFTGRGFGIQYNRTKDGGLINWEVFDESGNLVKSGTQATYYMTDTGRTCGRMVCTGLDYGKYRLVMTGDVNRDASAEYKETDGMQGGTGTYLGIESIVVETTMPENEVAKPSDDSIKILLNGEAIDFADVAPQIINDRTMVPLRAIFEALGAEVLWDDATKTVTAVKDDVTIKMTIGADSFYRNDEAVALDSPATIVDSRTLVPVRAIAESFGSIVSWEASTKTVTITDNNAPVIIFKFDDARPERLDETTRLNNAVSYLSSRNIPCSIGILSKWLESMAVDPDSYKTQKSMVESWILHGHQLWIHGYDHENGEFNGSSYDAQQEITEKSYDLIYECFGYETTSFGASNNSNDNTTINVLNSEFPQIKTVMFGKTDGTVSYNALNLTSENCYGSLESEVGVASYDSFITYFEAGKDADCIVFQGHPPYWDENSMEEFKKIVSYLEEMNCTFMTPEEYRLSLSQD